MTAPEIVEAEINGALSEMFDQGQGIFEVRMYDQEAIAAAAMLAMDPQNPFMEAESIALCVMDITERSKQDIEDRTLCLLCDLAFTWPRDMPTHLVVLRPGGVAAAIPGHAVVSWVCRSCSNGDQAELKDKAFRAVKESVGMGEARDIDPHASQGSA